MLSNRIFITLIMLTLSEGSRGQSGLNVPLSSTAGGAYQVTMQIIGVAQSDTEFLLDTGAAMMSINSAFFKVLQAKEAVHKLREVAVRLADGRRRLLSVYEVRGLRIADGCELGSVEAVLVPGEGRNLLGLNALYRLAPFTVNFSPDPILNVSSCGAKVSSSSLTRDTGAQ